MGILVLMILFGVLLPQVGLPPKIARWAAIALAIIAVVLFVVIDVDVRNVNGRALG